MIIIQYLNLVKGNEMELFNLEASKYGISLTTYFGDVYVFWRSIYLVIGIVVVLRIAKVLRKKFKK
jgi:uncharacterized membrane protein